jgi:diguanylate cyclase (GGDEF)-like protein
MKMPVTNLIKGFSFKRSISTKLLVACALVAICSSLAAIKVYLGLKETTRGLHEITDLYRPQQSAAQTIARQADLTHQRLFLFVAWSSVGVSAERTSKLGSDLTEALSKIKGLLDEPSLRRGLNSAELGLVTEASKQWDAYANSALDVLDIGSGDPALATVMLGGVDDQYRSIYQKITALNDAISDRGDRTASSVSLWASNASAALIAGQIALVALLIVLCALLYRFVFRPVAAVTAAMSAIARGATTAPLPLSRRTDEIGRMIQAIEDFRKKLEADRASIAYLAEHDALTGLSNRAKLEQKTNEVVERAARNGELAAILLIDLDGFKLVNDTQGHAAGDQLLIQVADRLRLCVSESEVIFRLGGDEFAILLEHLQDTAQAALFAKALGQVIGAPYDLNGVATRLSGSMGIALAPNDGATTAALLKRADMALYEAKAEGRNTFRFFRTDMEQRITDQRNLEGDLRNALHLRQFELVFQPLINARTRQTTTFEALIRWRHPTRGVVSPADFITIAEKIGLIEEIGGWVLGEACSAARNWPNTIRVAVNISGLQLHAGTLDSVVLDALRRTGLPAGRLELEITESVLINRSDDIIESLKRLRRRGVRIAVDDFGTGYCSLSYLRLLPFDKVKVDQSFVRDSCRASVSIIKAIAGLGSSLGAEVTAEGVETDEQCERIVEAGCTELQGYLFSRPMPKSEVSRFLLAAQDQEKVA